jgi:virginiamycin B lyase
LLPLARATLAFSTLLVLAACGKGTPITSGTPTPAPTPPPVVTAQYPIPTASSKPLAISLGSDGNLWFTESAPSKIGKLNPGGKITEKVTPTRKAGPFGIATGPAPNLNLWFTEFNVHAVGQITTSGAPFVEYTIPNSASTPADDTLGSDGSIWLADPGTNSIWRVAQIKIKPYVKFTQYVLTGNARPNTITNGPDGALWFTEPGTNRIGRLPISGSPLSEYDIPTKDSDPMGIAPGTDNALWFTEQKGEKIGRISTGGVVTAEYALPNAKTPDQILQGVDGNFYFTDTVGNRIGQFFFKSHHVNFYSIPTKDSGPAAMCLGTDQEIYFVETTGNKIGQFRYFAV